MDDIVLKAMAKWPNVPSCTGWLGLDSRGQWWMRDDQAQALGAFTSGVEGAKGSLLAHEKLIAFINRNYQCLEEAVNAKHKPTHSIDDPADARAGQWFFQNGPQRVYVELEATPWIWRVQPDFSIQAHTGQSCKPQRCIVDEHGCAYLETELGFGLIHTNDMLLVSDALERGLWVPQEIARRELPKRFGYVRSPQQAQSLLSK
jgi:Protein of unknown function (DUF2946)